MNIKTFACLAVILPLVFTTLSAGADAGASKPFLHPLFTDGMVLQRESKNPVWGWAAPGSRVTVSMGGLQAGAVADAAGRWQANLGPFKAGGPFTMTVVGEKTVALRDILVGDVWICSGQSNMDFATAGSVNGQEEVAAANHPQIRLFMVSRATAAEPLDLVTGQWHVCSPGTVGSFSAVGYFFGRKLNQDLQVPIGLIHAAWGGTVAEAWTSAEALGKLDDFKAPLAQAAALKAKYRHMNPDQALADWYRSGDPGTAHEWFRPDANTSGWQEVTLPAPLENLAGGIFEGIVWFQRSFDAPPAWAGQELVLELGKVDDIDTTWCNGVLAGSTDGWEKLRRYQIPGSAVKAGRNVVAVRLLNPIGGGGLIGPGENMRVSLASAPGTAIPLTGAWRMQTSTRMSNLGPLPGGAETNPNAYTALYNGMIAPLTPLAVRGVIWYQGEANVGRSAQYRTLLPALIDDWRSRFTGRDIGFHIVSLANFLQIAEKPSESAWAELREAQALTTRTLPDCGLALAIDIGEANDIHPKNKQEVGRRLALDAEALTYGARNVEWSGPWYESMRTEGDRLRLTFSHVGGGLVAKDGPLKGFAVAGADRHFVWADAVISGDSVVVSAPGVSHPVAARYAWGDNPVCNLYNKAGLPAVPFRTDAPPSSSTRKNTP